MPGGEERGQPWVSPLSTRSTASTAPSALPAPSYDPHVSRCSPRSSSFSTQSSPRCAFPAYRSCIEQRTFLGAACPSKTESSRPRPTPRADVRAEAVERRAQKSPCRERRPSRLPVAAVRARTYLCALSCSPSSASHLPPSASHLLFSSSPRRRRSSLPITHLVADACRLVAVAVAVAIAVSPHLDSDSDWDSDSGSDSRHGERIYSCL